MFSFELVYFASHPAVRVRLKDFRFATLSSRERGFMEFRRNCWRLGFRRTKTRVSVQPYQAMHFKFLVVCVLGLILTGGAFAAVVVEKRSHEMPYVEVFGCEGVHAFVFRGPKGTSRRPILVPPREYWTASEAGQYKFWLRDGSGHVCSRLVTPEVFARYRVGDDFNDCGPAIERTTEDSKSVEPVAHHHRRHTAQVWKRTHQRQIAKHHRNHLSHRIAAR
jgi:hypothetical protein